MTSLNSTINLDAKKFFRWWQRELSFLVPEQIRQRLFEQPGFIVVRPEGNQFALTYLANAKHVEEFGFEPLAILERNATGMAQYKTLRSKDERLAKANLVLRLSAEQAIQKELSFPVAAKENLSQVVAYELDRYTPFKAEQVYFIVKPLEGEQELGQIRVMLILTLRETLDVLHEDLKAFGMLPLFVDYEATPNDLEHYHDGYNLLPENLREKTANTPRLIYLGLIAGIFLLLGAVLMLPVWFEYQTVNVLQEKIDTLEKDAKSVKKLQQDLDAMIDETRLLIAEKNAAPSVIDMLNSLSTIIKDDTWLGYAQYSDGHLQIQGESPAASALISVLEDADMFANARFVSPVTQDKVSGQERLQITVDVIPAVLPKAMPSAEPVSDQPAAVTIKGGL